MVWNFFTDILTTHESLFETKKLNWVLNHGLKTFHRYSNNSWKFIWSGAKHFRHWFGSIAYQP